MKKTIEALQKLREDRIKIGFHVTDSSNIDTILDDGIKASPHHSAVYFWDTLKMARWFAEREFLDDEMYLEDVEIPAILEVDLTGIDLEKDPESLDMSQWDNKFKGGQFGGAYLLKGSMLPGAVLYIHEYILGKGWQTRIPASDY